MHNVKAELKILVNVPDAVDSADAKEKVINLLYELDTKHYDMQEMKITSVEKADFWCSKCQGELELIIPMKYSVDGYSGRISMVDAGRGNPIFTCIACGNNTDYNIDWNALKLINKE